MSRRGRSHGAGDETLMSPIQERRDAELCCLLSHAEETALIRRQCRQTKPNCHECRCKQERDAESEIIWFPWDSFVFLHGHFVSLNGCFMSLCSRSLYCHGGLCCFVFFWHLVLCLFLGFSYLFVYFQWHFTGWAVRLPHLSFRNLTDQPLLKIV